GDPEVTESVPARGQQTTVLRDDLNKRARVRQRPASRARKQRRGQDHDVFVVDAGVVLVLRQKSRAGGALPLLALQRQVTVIDRQQDLPLGAVQLRRRDDHATTSDDLGAQLVDLLG